MRNLRSSMSVKSRVKEKLPDFITHNDQPLSELKVTIAVTLFVMLVMTLLLMDGPWTDDLSYIWKVLTS